MRIASISEVDYSDLTFNVPKALILSSLEPSLGVTLACIPLLRPLLGRSKYSETGTARYNVSGDTGTSGRNGGLSGGGGQNKGFAVLDDDSSQHQLRPLGGKNKTDISHGNPSSRTSSDGDDGTYEGHHVRGRGGSKGITVKQTWLVSDS